MIDDLREALNQDFAPKRALAIVAHPDDIEYFCGGTLAKWITSGCTVSYLVTTSGDKGSADLDADTVSLVRIRESEQEASARTLGVQDVTFLRYPDSELGQVNQNDLRAEFVRHIRRTRAEVILSHDPLVRFARQHPDHRVVGQLALDASFPISAVAQCYREQIQDEGLSVWQPSYMLQFGTDQSNFWSDIGATLDLKVAALRAHVSQERAFPGGIEKRLRWKAAQCGAPRNLAAAEEFLLVQLSARIPVA